MAIEHAPKRVTLSAGPAIKAKSGNRTNPRERIYSVGLCPSRHAWIAR